VTLTVPGSVKLVVPFPAGTRATMPVSDQPEALGTTVAVMLPCVNTTLPGAAWKPLPLISMGKFTGLVGVVELFIFMIEGTGGGVVLLAPPQAVATITPKIARTKKPNELKRAIFLLLVSST
jgi:hypothetical protein